MNAAIEALISDLPELGIKRDVSFKTYTTLMAGGNAAYLADIHSVDVFAKAAAEAQTRNLPHIILGSGSNILPSDKGYDGLVLVNHCRAVRFSAGGSYVECGCWFQDVSMRAAQSGLSGLEFAVGIPGTLGGALVSNAGAYQASIGELLTGVEVVREGRRRWEQPEYLEFQYRDSILRRPEPPAMALLSVTMQLTPKRALEIYDKARDLQRQRISKQPPHPSAGSFFKNVRDPELAQRVPGLTPTLREKGVIPSAVLIEQCGLKGKTIGRARISERHANFICNLGGATAWDIRSLARLAKTQVMDKFGVEIEEEALYIGDWSDWS
jgi:UDP-N-acetylmuramate dehydrogenase